MDFARLAIQERKVRLILLGDSAATAFADELAQGLNISKEDELEGAAGLVDLTGQTDLPRVVSILKSSQVFVGNDSGLMHLAAALGIPTVGVFGSSNPDWTRPIGSRTLPLVVKGFSCHPCYLKVCNQKEFCLDSIPAGDVLQGIDGLLEMEN
jgi:lipopolysaccharide heptosyltransferase II